MTGQKARALQIGDQVMFPADGSRGIITNVEYAWITVHWDDGHEQRIHVEQASGIERASIDSLLVV